MNTSEGKWYTSLENTGVAAEKVRRSFVNNLVLCLIAAALVVFSSLTAHAQRRNIKTYQSADGLPENHITSLYQDTKGYMWFGTYSGAIRYNGFRWDIFDSSDGLRNNRITYITGDAEGRIYFCTNGGVAIFHNGVFTTITASDGLRSNSINSLYIDTDDTLLIASSGGLDAYNPDGSFRKLSSEVEFETIAVNNAYRDREGILWVGTDKGLYRRQDEGFVRETLPIEREKQVVNDITEDHEGRLLVATTSALVRETDEGFENYSEQLGIEEVEFYSFSLGPDGNLWVGTYYGVYQITADGEISTFDEEDGLSDEQVNRLLLDREKNLWIATEDGITKITPGIFTYYNSADGLPSDEVFDVTEDSQGQIWVATEEGLVFFSPDLQRQTILGVDEGLDTDFIEALEAAPDGKVYIGTNKSVWVYENGLLKKLENGTGVSCIFTTNKGRVWIGTASGLQWVEPNDPYRVQQFEKDHPLANLYVNCLAEDSMGRLWIGTSSAGCIMYDGGKTTAFDSSNGCSSQDIWAITPSILGGVLIGTNGDGLIRYRNGEFSRITAADGLSSNYVWQILPDYDGNLWIGTNRGIDRFDGNRFIHLDIFDGLATNEGYASASMQDSRGRLWFGSRAGLSVTTNENLRLRPDAGSILIEKISVGDKTYEYPGSLELDPSVGTIDIHFTSMYFRNEGAVLYRYRLRNVETNWSTPAHLHSVRYASLQPGSYTFEVEATTDGGRTWSRDSVALPIHIPAPFYQTLAFTFIVITLLGILTMAGYRLQATKARRDRLRLERQVSERTNELALANTNLLKINNDLERLNTDLGAFSSSVSHDLRAPLNRITGYTQLLEDTLTGEHSAATNKYLKRIIQDTKRMGELIQDLLKLSTARETEIEKEEVNLTLLCRQVFSDLRRGNTHQNLSTKIENDMLVSGDLRLLRIVMENLIGNAWKYTAEAERPLIHIGCEEHDGETIVFVRDNGIGFDQDRVDKLFKYFGRLHTERQYRGLGIGLVTVKRIIQRHGGKVWAEGIAGEGATFYFSLARRLQHEKNPASADQSEMASTEKE